MKTIKNIINEKPWLAWVFYGTTMLLVFLIGLLASSVVERRSEALYAYSSKMPSDTFISDNSYWGKMYPREYQSYLKTSDTSFRSKYNGAATVDLLSDNPSMVILFAGYAFSKDYKQARGHYYAVNDVLNSLRTGAPMKPADDKTPATCWTCKSPDVPRMMIKIGVDSFYRTKWSVMAKEMNNFIGCADCHDPATMNLTITRPALIEAFERQGKDIRLASHQEMRSLVCAQCHVEYYFKGEGKYLTFPWDKGTTAENIEAYYDSVGFADWTHLLSKTPMIKAQHPDYELYSMGIHAQRGVSCADCHMPYKSEGGQKFTDHHIQSPLNNISSSCQVCHRESEAELTRNINERQDKLVEIRTKLEEQLVKAHMEAKYAWDNGANEAQMKPALAEIRAAQWRWDFAAAGHGSSFHAPIELSRIVANGIDRAHNARLTLSRVLASMGKNESITLPDISTKEKAQQYIGLDMAKLNSAKQEFLKK